MQDFGLSYWGENNFFIDGDDVRINHGQKPSLLEITQDIRSRGYKGPLYLRFPHLISRQVDALFGAFAAARDAFEYQGGFSAVFPLKVNQYPNFINHLLEGGQRYRYGLEAGSKAELIIAMAKTPPGSPITINGFKDKEMISLAFIGAKSGHDITITIESIGELETIIAVHRELNAFDKGKGLPKIGMRIRLHSAGVGNWAKSGGYSSKFGLTSTELLEAYTIISRYDLLDHFTMIHFHIGSQTSEIMALKKALREAGNIYADLKRRGADHLCAINIGGGLAVAYNHYQVGQERNYSLQEFANDVVFLMQQIAKSKGVDDPNIFTESGRYISAGHAVLIAPVLELFSQEYRESTLRLKESNPHLINELHDLYHSIGRHNAREYLHDALDHMESLLTLFDLGYIDLDDRSNAETLTHLIIKRVITLLGNEDTDELKQLQNHIQERYLLNFSFFQSLPDMWALGQHFPIMPISHLSQKPTRPASIWDITCDSDGEIPFDANMPLYLHEVDLESEEYFLAFFLTGAYQEVLGMRHNLFTHPTEAVIAFDEKGEYQVEGTIQAQSLVEILDDLDYDTNDIIHQLKEMIGTSELIDMPHKERIQTMLHLYLSENSYLKTIQAGSELLEEKG